MKCARVSVQGAESISLPEVSPWVPAHMVNMSTFNHCFHVQLLVVLPCSVSS